MPVPGAGMRVGVARHRTTRTEPGAVVDVGGGMTGQPVGPGGRSSG
ncbi:MAG TPA: hypothetical protein VFL71_04260 [Actinomycetes bacterium]|nr:hypothetical protein [Actinomycetes bacterium]